MAHYYMISKTRTVADIHDSGRTVEFFPEAFSILAEGKKLLLVVAAEGGLNDNEIFQKVQQECDRITFLTGEDLEPHLIRKANADGSVTSSSKRSARTAGWRAIPRDVVRQKWESALAVQLRLWQLASLRGLPLNVRIILLFQIIEVAYPMTGSATQYPEYRDCRNDPDPRTEAKLLRDLASHGKKHMDNPQIGVYCDRYGISHKSNDPTDPRIMQLFASRINVIEIEARRIIEQSITRV